MRFSRHRNLFPPLFIPFEYPSKATYQALFEAGAEALKWVVPIGGADGVLASFGIPTVLGGFTKAPFDVIGDTLRGTKGVMLDIYRQPDKLLKALEALVPLMIGMGIANAQQTGNPVIFIPLHKGADALYPMSNLKVLLANLGIVMLGLIDGGCVAISLLRRVLEHALDVIQDIRGKTLWMIDQSDMAKVTDCGRMPVSSAMCRQPC
jgi:hypothetical protein